MAAQTRNNYTYDSDGTDYGSDLSFGEQKILEELVDKAAVGADPTREIGNIFHRGTFRPEVFIGADIDIEDSHALPTRNPRVLGRENRDSEWRAEELRIRYDAVESFPGYPDCEFSPSWKEEEIARI
jgi:hypothetical protein